MTSPARQIVSNTAAQLFAKGVAVALTLLSTLLILRLGGAGLFGDLTKALALVTIGFTALDFGLNAHAVRSMQGSLASQRQVLGDTLLLRLLLALLAILALNLLVYHLPGGYSGEVKDYFWLGSLAILPQGLYTSANAWFQRRLQYWYSSLAVIFGTLAGTLFTLYFLLTRPSLFGLLLSSTLGYTLMAVISLLLLGRHLPRRYSLSRSFVHLRASLILGAILICSILASKLDTVVMGIFRPSAEVGQYGFAYRIFDVAIILPVFVMNAVYPLLVASPSAAKTALIKRSSIYLLALGILGALILVPLAPLIYLVKPDMHLAVLSFRLLALSLPLFYLTAPLMWQLIEARLERPLLLLYFLAALLNGSLNYFFTPRFGPPSAAAITFLTELFILLGLLYIRARHGSRS